MVAIATPAGPGGIGVVRMSGPSSREIFARLWRGRVHPSGFEPRKLYLGRVDLADHESPITDHVMAVHMPAPNTYTGEDVVEISCHGSQPLLAKLVDACVAAGARTAGPGEFTRRAFLAGKMDLAQAEAVCDLISAEGERGARIAAEQLQGRLSREIRLIADATAGLRARVEAAIDFPDEEIDDEAGLAEAIANTRKLCARLASTFENGRMMRNGVRVAIAGRPNAGKSSVLNRIVGFDRALVHHAPGTTRDVVEERASIDGLVFSFLDTAGLRTAAGEVESLGIEKSKAAIASADLTLVVFDGSRRFSGEDREALKLALGKKALYVVNKSDLPQNFDIEELEAEPVRTSAFTGDGFGELAKRLAWEAIGAASSSEGAVVISARHKSLLDAAGRALEGALAELAARRPAEFAAQWLRAAHEALNEITGEAATEELLDRIFSKFCIGK